jgi:galactose-1-phosphate uridylyltransferase
VSLQTQIISLYHDSAAGGHSGTIVTAKRVANGFYWKGQQKYIRQYTRECPICQQNKFENTHTPGLLQPLPILIAPFLDNSMDFVEGLPKSEGREVIFVVVDRFSKYAHFIAIPHPYTASSVVRVFIDNVYKLHGLPVTIVSDKDAVF